ncbi:MAG: signal peptidase II [Candidatus Puniceispirillaceae bacterium]
MVMMPKRQDMVRFITVVIAVMIADFVTKSVMLSLIFDPPRVIAVFPFLNFAPAWNEGVSFGLLASGGQWTRHGISLLAVVVVLWLFFQLADLAKWQKLAAAFISGGALGNALDRQIYGRVVDFIDFHLGTWHYPAFNIADTMIFTGVALWVVEVLIQVRQQSRHKQIKDKQNEKR